MPNANDADDIHSGVIKTKTINIHRMCGSSLIFHLISFFFVLDNKNMN